jgi:pimeloyl-ACP methyl ester carboxylesterase
MKDQEDSVKKRQFAGLVTSLLAFTALSSYMTSFQRWKRRTMARVQTESTLAMTALGPIEYQSQGEGPALLIAHGSPGGYDQSIAFAKLLNSQGHTNIAVSRPGYLRTPLSSGRSPEEQADLYAALFDTLDISQATIIGISGGAPSALQFAIRHPQRCRGLVMVSGVTQSYSEYERLNTLPLPFRFSLRWLKHMYGKITMSDAVIFMLLPLARLLPKTLASVDMLNSAMFYRLRERGYKNDMVQFEKIASYPLERITAPIFILHGTSDNDVSFAHAENLAQRAPHTKLYAIKYGSHLAFFTHAKMAMPEIRDFLDSLKDGSAPSTTTRRGNG